MTVLTLHTFQMRPNVVFLADALLRPLHRNPLFAREGFNPALVLVGSFRQRFLCDRVDFLDVPKKMNHVLLADQQRQVSLDDDAGEAVIYQHQQFAKQGREQFHAQTPEWITVADWPGGQNGAIEAQAANRKTSRGRKGISSGR